MTASVCVRGARWDDLPAIVDLACVAFGEELRERFRRGLYDDSSYRPEHSRVAEIDGRIVSHVRVRDRPIHYAGAVLQMGGIGTVATLPAYRGRGLATRLLRDAISCMHARGHHLSMLFTGRFSFYAPLGWAAFPGPSFRWPVPSVPDPAVADGYGVRPFDPDRDLPTVEAIYDEYNGRRTGPYVRSHRFWLEALERRRGVLPMLVAAREDVVAYATFQVRGDALAIDEAGCRAGAAGAFAALARALVRQAPAAAARWIEGGLPRDHGLAAALQQLSSTPLEWRLGGGMMLRVVDLRGLFEAARPVLSERLGRRPWQGAQPTSFGFRVGDEYVRLGLGPGDLTLDGEPAARDLDLDPGLFFRLFLGESPPALLAEHIAVRGQYLGADELALLGMLFPPRDPIYWTADDF